MLGTITMGTSVIANFVILYIFLTTPHGIRYMAIVTVIAVEIVVCLILTATIQLSNRFGRFGKRQHLEPTISDDL